MQLGIHQLSQIFQTPQIALTLHLRAVFFKPFRNLLVQINFKILLEII